MNRFFSRVPSAALQHYFDGHVYAHIPHAIDQATGEVIENLDAPRMMRFDDGRSFIRGGEAYVYFAGRGAALPLPKFVPFGVTIEPDNT